MDGSDIWAWFRTRPLQVGARAPGLTAIDQNGLAVSLDAAFAAGPVLLYFYVRAGTPVCTAQACRLRDQTVGDAVRDLNIFAVSSDPPKRLRKFAEKRQLPFRLLSDADGRVAKGFGVRTLFGIPARVAFLICDGVVVWSGVPRFDKNKLREFEKLVRADAIPA